MTTLDTTLLEEITGALSGCLATIELALAVTDDAAAKGALEAVGLVIASSHEHLSRVDAMVFAQPGEAEDTGPVVMGQPAEDCQHLDPVPWRDDLLCPDCGDVINVAEVTGE